MLSSVEIITTPTSDTPGSALVLDFPDKRYLIGNIHEGLSRALLERGVRVSRVNDIFITGRTEWKNIGGLLGTVLSVADVRAAAAAAVATLAEEKAARMRERGITGKNSEKGHQRKKSNDAFLNHLMKRRDDEISDESASSRLTIHGGPNITHSLAAARKFIFRKGMPLRVDEFQESGQRRQVDCEWKPDWADERVRVWSMAVAPTENSECGSLRKPESPLKRRYEDFVEPESNAAVAINPGPNLASADSSAEDQRVRALIVAHMFDSAWRPDQYEEVSLAAIPVPVTAKIFIRDQTTQEIRPYSGPMPDGANPVPQINVLVRKPWPGALIKQLPSTKPSKVALSYIFRTHTQRGKFQPEKAKLLKVPAGPLWGELVAGRSVQSTDGQTINPDMVLLEAREGGGFAVVDLPSPEYVQNLVERPEWQAPAVMNGVEMIMWILGPGVGQNEQLLNFMCHHGNLKHIISSQDHCPNYISFESGASGAIQLHQINPVQYPIPVHDNAPPVQMGQSKFGQNPNVEFAQAERGVKLMLTPSVYFKKDKITPTLNTVRVLTGTSPDALRLAMAARETIDSETCQKEIREQNIPSPDAEITCLGTGSAIPSKYRNVSSTLLRVPGSGSYLLDCGENTLGQLKRIYRPKQLSELLRDLKLIWISHLHADHHLGLPSVIKAWYEEVHGQNVENPQDPTNLSADHGAEAAQRMSDKHSLILVCSHRMHAYLREYSEVEDIGLRYLTRLSSIGATDTNPLSVLHHHHDRKIEPIEIQEALRTAGISELQSCFVKHCDGAQAVSLTFPTGFKFSYSGDCRPSKTFAQIGKDSTVLLHEATFDDELESDARTKKHSTTSEAIGVGVAMGARRILLTHFSQRYQKLPVMSKVKAMDVKLERESDASDGIDETDPEIALTAGEGEEPDANITQSLGANRELATSDAGSGVPQTTPEANAVSVNQAPPSDLKIGVAFDYMRVKVGDIIHLEKFTPALLKLFEQQERDEEVGMQEEAGNDNNDEKGEGPLTPKKEKLKLKAEKKARNNAEKTAGNKTGTKAGEGREERSIDNARSQAPPEKRNDDETGEPKRPKAEESTQPLPANWDSIST